MLSASLAILIGLILLVWSADKFVEGAASSARHFGMSPLLIGILIVGLGTSSPEMIVSASSALNGVSGIALGNAYGSNITNIALILGITVLIKPIIVASEVIKKELPILIAITLISAYFLIDAKVTQLEAIILLIIFAFYIGWTIWIGVVNKQDRLATMAPLETENMPLKKSLFWIVVGLLTLMASSRLLVWGAVEIAHQFQVSDLVIGLTIIAVGTSLPELASSIIAARKGQSDLALGNIVGSNLFNTLAVVGIAGAVEPMQVEDAVFSRDMLVMLALTLLLFLFSLSLNKKPGKITRLEGAILFSCYLAYTLYLLNTAI
ncbi:calcium/sodium:proton antiporter [[Haemophilus] ducreyi]|uniref:Sodium/calcium exchange protein n=2 Tax=Haemophilus ducreyi TaxID=730 RepID=Q7VMZ2_HAEDU|nr:calcium/sodium antiporter [[Haemophilus] ducreyi]AAP95709.1 putative sodium/calcium exchange protein [[Haemophilus] ducreyi 35000HP]AKO30768.1 calcium/sodium:proton antiporter [[Haemophilus] ducreyi]AKO32206.1 calcium/sodium:proton antiporter [[Haemophilus] ducreyi]AKO33660.1 calcium/sodium:proton antiporter [[Haemophilus] ducreyi]AKO35107.1 calcium/sodium:proton antiporter [[Haemophilus] ducreyi]